MDPHLYHDENKVQGEGITSDNEFGLKEHFQELMRFPEVKSKDSGGRTHVAGFS